MRSTGVRRKLDDLGRVVIPAGIRRSLDLRDGDAMEFTVHGDRIILTRATDRCVVCGHQGEGLRELRGRKLCEQCIEEVAALDAETPRGGPDGQDADGDAGSDDAAADGGQQPRSEDDDERVVPLSRSPDLEQESADLDQLRREAYEPASTTAW